MPSSVCLPSQRNKAINNNGRLRNSFLRYWPRLTRRHKRIFATLGTCRRTRNRWNSNTSFPTHGRHTIKTMIHFIKQKRFPVALPTHPDRATSKTTWNQSSHSVQSQQREITLWTNQNSMWKSFNRLPTKARGNGRKPSPGRSFLVVRSICISFFNQSQSSTNAKGKQSNLIDW